jgi:hypothetical protein
MHVPIGRSGVQAVPNTLHSHGLMTPFRHAHARNAPAQLGVQVRVRLRQLEPALGDEAHAAPLEVRPQLEHLRHHLERAQVALVGDDALVLVLDLAAALTELAQDHQDALEDVERLEAGNHDGLAVVGGDELERPRADDGRHVPRADEPVQAQVRRVQQRAQRRHDRHVAAHAEEVLDALELRALERQRGRRRGRLEPDREEHDVAVGVRLRDPQCVERRVDHPHVGALGLGLEQRAPRSRHAHHVAEAREDHAGLVRERDAVVDAAHRDDADRAAGAVHQLDVGRQQVVDAVLVDRVRVAAADLHHLVVTARLDRRQDLTGHGAAQLGVAELVDELQAAALPIAVPAWTSSESPGATGLTSAISTVSWSPASFAHSASSRRSSTFRTRRATAVSPQVMQCES